jgi:hypothetical protein
MKAPNLQSYNTFLCKFSGEDVFIIASINERKTTNYFSFIGALVVSVFFGCFISASIFSSFLFEDSFFLDTFIGLFWGLVISVIYIFLLYTITPSLLPSKYKSGNKLVLGKTLAPEDLKKLNYTPGGFASVSYKYIYIFIISIVVAQPINILFFSKNQDASFLIQLKQIISMPICWTTTFLAFCTFLFPILLKYRIRTTTEFYEHKQIIEKKIVEEEYNEFKKKYSLLLTKNNDDWNRKVKQNLQEALAKLRGAMPDKSVQLENEIDKSLSHRVITKYEHWADAPFNVTRKSDERVLDNEENLINLLYSKE